MSLFLNYIVNYRLCCSGNLQDIVNDFLKRRRSKDSPVFLMSVWWLKNQRYIEKVTKTYCKPFEMVNLELNTL